MAQVSNASTFRWKADHPEAASWAAQKWGWQSEAYKDWALLRVGGAGQGGVGGGGAGRGGWWWGGVVWVAVSGRVLQGSSPQRGWQRQRPALQPKPPFPTNPPTHPPSHAHRPQVDSREGAGGGDTAVAEEARSAGGRGAALPNVTVSLGYLKSYEGGLCCR